jgi:cytidylate kinase
MSDAQGSPTQFAFRDSERESLASRLERHRDAAAALVVAIDGPAGSGKSTTARRVAQRLGLRYLDTGALYRAVTLAAHRNGVAITDAEGLARLAASADVRVEQDRVWLDGEDVHDAIRSPQVTADVSGVSAIPEVRAAMLGRQRAIAKRAGTVMDGRDIGTVVLPRADLKVFLTADAQTRARRRQAEEAQRGPQRDLDSIAREIAARDHADSTRSNAPLQCAPDAVRVDTTSMSVDEQVDAVVALALRRLEAVERTLATSPADDEWLDPSDWAQPDYRPFHGKFYRVTHATVGTAIRQLVGMCRKIHPAARGTGSLLVACNHISGLDPPAVSTALPFEVWFVAKRELFRYPLFGRIIAALNAFPIRRGTADYEALDRAIELLRGGRNVLMFPEGTRQRPGKLGAPRWGFGYVAHHADRPVVPAFVRGTRDWRLRGLRRQPMEVWVGQPYLPQRVEDPDQDDYRRIGAAAMQRIAALMLRSAAGKPLPGLDAVASFAASASPDVIPGR